MKSRKIIALLLTTALTAAMFSGCGEKAPSGSGTGSGSDGGKPDLKIGVIAPLTGNFAEHGKGFEIAMTLAVDEINAAGGINGRKMALTFNDTEGDNKKAADLAATYAEDEEYVAMLGGFSSGCAMSAAPICEQYKFPFVSPTASNIAFAQSNKYCFSIPATSKTECPLMAINCCANYCGAKSVFVFALNSDWGLSALEGFKIGAEQAGVEVLGEETYVSGETDFSAMVTKAVTANPDMLVILDQAPAVLINQIRTAGITTRIGNYGGSTSNEPITLCGENAEGLTTISIAVDTSRDVYTNFVKNFTERAGFDPTMWANYAYTATYILRDAIERCGDNVTREAIQQELEKTDGDYLVGNFTFNEDGNRALDPKTAPYEVYEVKGGEWVMVG